MNQPTQLLLVEDDEFVRRALVRGLGILGVVSAVATAEAAVELLTMHRYQIVLSDYSLEGPTSGLDLLRAARKQDPEIKTVLITGVLTPELGQTLVDEGQIDRFFGKPWNLQALRAAVKSLCDLPP